MSARDQLALLGAETTRVAERAKAAANTDQRDYWTGYLRGLSFAMTTQLLGGLPSFDEICWVETYLWERTDEGQVRLTLDEVAELRRAFRHRDREVAS